MSDSVVSPKQKSKLLIRAYTREAIIKTHMLARLGHFGPAKGERGLERRAKKRRHRANERRRYLVACRKATVALNRHGIYIEPRTKIDESAEAILRRMGVK